jgi:hypothetical protein
MTVNRSRFVAWLALCATLFSAVSPALAAAFVAERPAALAQMLGLPAAAADPDQHAHAMHAGHQHHPMSPAPNQPHDKHGIYCSFCLNASSTVAIAAIAPVVIVTLLAALASPPEHDDGYFSIFRPQFRSRAPPR